MIDDRENPDKEGSGFHILISEVTNFPSAISYQLYRPPLVQCGRAIHKGKNIIGGGDWWGHLGGYPQLISVTKDVN